MLVGGHGSGYPVCLFASKFLPVCPSIFSYYRRTQSAPFLISTVDNQGKPMFLLPSVYPGGVRGALWETGTRVWPDHVVRAGDWGEA